MEDNLRWKTTFNERRPSMEDNLRWKMTFDGRCPSTKTTFDGRWPSIEDDLRWKTTIGGKHPSMEDGLWWKTTFDGRRLLMEDDLVTLFGASYITWKNCGCILTLKATAQLTPNWKSYQLSKPEIEFHLMNEMYAALCMCTCAEKMISLGKDD